MRTKAIRGFRLHRRRCQHRSPLAHLYFGQAAYLFGYFVRQFVARFSAPGVLGIRRPFSSHTDRHPWNFLTAPSAIRSTVTRS
jgi:hypothetical protein